MSAAEIAALPGCAEARAPRFSVVVPLYNKHEFIGETLESVRAQEFEDWELIVVDDGSTDGSAEVVERFAAGDGRVRLIRQENAGVSAARNRGIRAAHGEFVCFLDADDIWMPIHLAELDATARACPEASLIFTKVAVKKGGEMKCGRWFNKLPEGKRFYVESYPCAMAVEPNVVNSSNVAIEHRALLGQKMWFREDDAVGEDLDMWLRIALAHRVAASSALGAVYNRDTRDNARTRNRVHFPAGYFATIRRALAAPEVSPADKRALRSVFDRKYTAYVFSLLCAGERSRARGELDHWAPQGRYAHARRALIVASALPSCIARAVMRARLRRS